MTVKKFIVKVSIKVLLFVIISMIAITLLQTPIITNKIAMTQMENSDEMYVMMETYYKLVPIIRIVYGFVVVLFSATTIYDIYKFLKTKNKGDVQKNEEVNVKENNL